MKGRFESIDIRAKNYFFFRPLLYRYAEEVEEEAEKIIIEKKTIIFHSTGGGPPNLFNVGLYMLRAVCVYIYTWRGRSGFTFDRIFTHTHTQCTLYVSGVASKAHNFLCRIPARRCPFHSIISIFFFFPISSPDVLSI